MATATVVTESPVVEADAIEEGVLAVSATDVGAAIAALNTPGSSFYSSIKGDDFAGKKLIAKALTKSSPIDEHLGEVISLVNIVIMPVDLANEKGEVNTAPRVILIDDKDVAYHATSIGLLSAVRNLFATMGEPEEWPEPQDIKIVQQKGRNGFKFFTIELV